MTRRERPIRVWLYRGWCAVCWPCGRIRSRWNNADPLYRANSHRCPDCHRDDIDHDTAARRREDR